MAYKNWGFHVTVRAFDAQVKGLAPFGKVKYRKWQVT